MEVFGICQRKKTWQNKHQAFSLSDTIYSNDPFVVIIHIANIPVAAWAIAYRTKGDGCFRAVSIVLQQFFIAYTIVFPEVADVGACAVFNDLCPTGVSTVCEALRSIVLVAADAKCKGEETTAQ
jgi:hypothetical protein